MSDEPSDSRHVTRPRRGGESMSRSEAFSDAMEVIEDPPSTKPMRGDSSPDLEPAESQGEVKHVASVRGTAQEIRDNTVVEPAEAAPSGLAGDPSEPPEAPVASLLGRGAAGARPREARGGASEKPKQRARRPPFATLESSRALPAQPGLAIVPRRASSDDTIGEWLNSSIALGD